MRLGDCHLVGFALRTSVREARPTACYFHSLWNNQHHAPQHRRTRHSRRIPPGQSRRRRGRQRRAPRRRPALLHRPRLLFQSGRQPRDDRPRHRPRARPPLPLLRIARLPAADRALSLRPRIAHPRPGPSQFRHQRFRNRPRPRHDHPHRRPTCRNRYHSSESHDEAQVESFLQIVADGFTVANREIFRAHARKALHYPNTFAYIASIDGTPAAAASCELSAPCGASTA